MSVKDQYNISDSSTSSEVGEDNMNLFFINSVSNLQKELEILKSSYLKSNFLLMSLIGALQENGVVKDEDIRKHEDIANRSYYMELEREFSKENRLETVDRKSKKGDFLFISFEGRVDGKQILNASSPWHIVILGESKLLFEKELYNRSNGEEFNIEVDVPDNHYDEEIKGKKVSFKIKVYNIKESLNGE